MKLFKALGDLHLHGDMLIEKHDILEKAMKVYLKMKWISKTHYSVADKHLSAFLEIKESILLDNTRVKVVKDSNGTMNERRIDMSFGEDDKAIVRKEIVTILIQKMEQMRSKNLRKK